VYPRVIVHNTPPLGARDRAGLARFGPGVQVGGRSTYGGWAGRGDSIRLHPESPRPSRHAATPGRSADPATFFSCVVRSRTRDPVCGLLPVGPQAVQGPADAFIPQTPHGHALCMYVYHDLGPPVPALTGGPPRAGLRRGGVPARRTAPGRRPAVVSAGRALGLERWGALHHFRGRLHPGCPMIESG
jgi:hypothetical protein